MKWSIWYKHTFTGDTFEGTYKEAEQFGIKNVKEYLEEENISLPVVVNNCGKRETCATYKDFIEEIEEYYYDDDDEETEE